MSVAVAYHPRNLLTIIANGGCTGCSNCSKPPLPKDVDLAPLS
jgi:hypothetical protein